MNNGAKAAIGGTVVLVLAVGGELLWLHHERNAPAVVKAPEREVTPDDDLVFLKKKRPDSMKEVKELAGSTLWVSGRWTITRMLGMRRSMERVQEPCWEQSRSW
jgi:hypothetical protein